MLTTFLDINHIKIVVTVLNTRVHNVCYGLTTVLIHYLLLHTAGFYYNSLTELLTALYSLSDWLWAG